MLIGQVLALAGTAVTMLGRREASLALPRSLGLTTALVDELPDDGFDIVVEATGNEAGLSHSLRLVKPLGKLVMKSTFAGKNTVDLNKIVVGELTVIGSRCGPFSPALRLLEADKIELRAMIDGEYFLNQGIQAFQHAAKPGVRKIMLQP
jgi:threonine dehydrogenase-like Zn-dependent dehydrogenase